nr:hypothetical protein [Hoeflea alexandrii]
MPAARKPAILIGGGAVRLGDAVRRFAKALDAPVISTTNARGIMSGHPLDVLTSPSLTCVREMLAGFGPCAGVGDRARANRL